MLDDDRVAPPLRDRDRDDLVCEQALLDGDRSPLVRRRCDLVHLSRLMLSPRVVVRRGAHQAVVERAPQAIADDGVGELDVAVPETGTSTRREVRRIGHRLHAAGHDDVGVARPHHLIGEVDRVET